MTLAEREKAIKTFTEDGDCRIFLMSLKAGGVALNLTVASYVSNFLSFFFLISFLSFSFILYAILRY